MNLLRWPLTLNIQNPFNILQYIALIGENLENIGGARATFGLKVALSLTSTHLP